MEALGPVGRNALTAYFGFREIGLAGGKAKRDWLLERGRVDHCIDCTNEGVEESIAA